MSWHLGWEWRQYVPVYERRARAARTLDRLRRKGVNTQPVEIRGRDIARTFWGRAWCEHLEKFSDFGNRLPRGRSYVRNGLVCHLDIQKGKIAAKVSGSAVYDVDIAIKTLSLKKWKTLKAQCAGRVGSMLELLQGKLSGQVMSIVTDRDGGLFPLPKEIALECSCPDWADMCKHVAAVLYGVGARLDSKPELLFLLRGVDHNELIGKDAAKAVIAKAPTCKGRLLNADSLTRIFGIDLADGKQKKRPRSAAASRSVNPPGALSWRKKKTPRAP